MCPRSSVCFLLCLAISGVAANAQSLLPVATSPVENVSAVTSPAGVVPATVDLRRHFGFDGLAINLTEEGGEIVSAEASNTLIYMDCSMGPMLFELQEAEAPQTTALFRSIIDPGSEIVFRDWDSVQFSSPPRVDEGSGPDGVNINDERRIYDYTLIHRSYPPESFYDNLAEDYISVFRQREFTSIPTGGGTAVARVTFPGPNNDIEMRGKFSGGVLTLFGLEFRYDPSLTGDTAWAEYIIENEVSGQGTTIVYLNRGVTTANSVIDALNRDENGLNLPQGLFTFRLDSQANTISNKPEVDDTNDGTGVVNAQPQPDVENYLEGGYIGLFGDSDIQSDPREVGALPVGELWQDIVNPYLVLREDGQAVPITERNTDSGLSNTRGTLSMILEEVPFPGGGEKYTGLRWAINTTDNSASFDNSSLDTPYNVIGRAIGGTMAVADAINSLNWFDRSQGIFGPYNKFPLMDSYEIVPGDLQEIQAEDFVTIYRTREISLFEPTDDVPPALSFEVADWSGAAESVSITNNYELVITPLPGVVGDVEITVNTKDLHENIASQTFTVSIEGADYATWRGLAFEPDDVGNDSVSGPTADPEDDQITNLEEYFFGFSPQLLDTPVVEAFYRELASPGDERAGIRFPQSSSVTGVTSFIERYTEGQGWQEQASSVSSSVPDTPETQLITRELDTNTSSETVGILRLGLRLEEL